MYSAESERYNNFEYVRCGKSGLKLPPLSLGLWHNFGREDDYEKSKQTVLTAFDSGITHFDLANNYGPPPGAAEQTFGKILREELGAYRDEIIVSTKAGHPMWDGPYGDWGSRKHLTASLDQSLERLGLDYVDIFYTHRPDPETPLEETIRAVSDSVMAGKALYPGISKYKVQDTINAIEIFERLDTPLLVHQINYSMLDRTPENLRLWDVLKAKGKAAVVFSPLAQGLLTDKYLNGIPEGSRAAREGTFLSSEKITPKLVEKIKRLNEIARQRSQTLAQMALQWATRDDCVCSAIVGASSPEQILDSLEFAKAEPLSEEQLKTIENILSD
ncbi:L-glyceraldehyde 3-phosphate reductase [Sedimentisphaera cyanobacteriorum]|uniref:L-glyceraldehyde 3-phosphate reductase n=1 Tax=Sedimentisphaera cyanobacteriorum TaxID=1940790 RepID=A0A1Q2HM86_9BACT|nr:aldo/keto reductase [Sedimentisphaera cyanobacteriorum]AQQ08639.1 L-glyceraldehyde 3-phosphate reductase [Sedimentisphaera cyanobacteriorum]